MDWQQRMNQAIAWIEQHLADMDVGEGAAREACCSPFHFMRMFAVITGMTVGEYVRQRRLSRAAAELVASDEKIIDIALQAGYDSPDAFAKAFRKLFGCTPSTARRPGTALRLYPPITFTISLKGAQALEYRIEPKSAFSVTGLALRAIPGTNNPELSAFWAQCASNGTLGQFIAKIPAGSELGLAGVCAEMDPATKQFTYLIAIETPSDRSGLPAGCRDVAVPASTWGIFDAVGPLPGSIQQTWGRVFSEWFPSSGWEHADAPDLEIYPEGDTSSPSYVCQVWVPLRKVAN